MSEKNFSTSHLIRGKLLAQNALWNLAGQGLPLMAGLVAIPILINGLGTERFGILTLVWVVLGYFNLFDFGIARALIKLVAEKLGNGQSRDIPQLVWTAVSIMTLLGITGAIMLSWLTPWLVETVLNIPEGLRKESIIAFYLLALSVPVMINSTAFRGILESYQLFRTVTAVRIPLGLFIYLGPLIILSFSKNISHIVGILVLARLIVLVIYFLLCLRLIPGLNANIRIKFGMLRSLLSFGGWITLSQLIGPILLYVDRFLLASFISISVVAYYTTPYEIVIKLLIIPLSVLGVMFPAFSTTYANNIKHLKYLYYQTIKYNFLLLFPCVLVLILFAKAGLKVWLHGDFAEQSYLIVQVLSIAVFINSFGHISQSLIQASGRPDITAKLHVVELPLYLIYLSRFLKAYGINGAAFAWLTRVTISSIILAFLSKRYILSNNSKTIFLSKENSHEKFK